MLPAAHPGMQAEGMRIDAQARRGFLVPTQYGSQAEDLLAGARQAGGTAH